MLIFGGFFVKKIIPFSILFNVFTLTCYFKYFSFSQIFDCSGWANTLLAELFVPIPEAAMVTGTLEVEPFEFSSDHFVTYKHSGIGSGKLNVPLPFYYVVLYL